MNEDRLRAITDTIPQLVWSSRPDGYIDYCNAQWLAYTGLAEDEIKGDGWSVALHPEDKDETFHRWRAATASGDPYYVEQRLRRYDGVYKWFLTRANPLKDAQGDVTKWYGTCTDIDAQKAGQAILQTEAQRKDDFIALLAHELRNPLAPIRTSAKILSMRISDGPVEAKCLEVIERQIAIMSRLLDDLLDISRINREIIRLEWKPFRIVDAIRSAIDTVQEALTHHKQQVSLRVSSDELFVYGDVFRIEQVLVNLLNNAAKYSGGPGYIDISVAKHDESARIVIKDTGMGIGSDLLPHIFEPFVQGSRSIDRMAGGLGVGLNLAKRLVELHHGEILARSEGVGKGSEFEVLLPLSKPSDSGAYAAA